VPGAYRHRGREVPLQETGTRHPHTSRLRQSDAPHQRRLPHGLFQHDPLGSEGELLALVGVGCGTGLPHPQVLPTGALEIESQVGHATGGLVQPEPGKSGDRRRLLSAEAEHATLTVQQPVEAVSALGFKVELSPRYSTTV